MRGNISSILSKLYLTWLCFLGRVQKFAIGHQCKSTRLARISSFVIVLQRNTHGQIKEKRYRESKRKIQYWGRGTQRKVRDYFKKIQIFLLKSTQVMSILILFLAHLVAHIQANRPHILLIILDDVGRADTGIYGESNIQLPNLKSLTKDGVILENFYTQTVCSPTRSALLTGRYPFRFGMQHITVWTFK